MCFKDLDLLLLYRNHLVAVSMAKLLEKWMGESKKKKNVY